MSLVSCLVAAHRCWASERAGLAAPPALIGSHTLATASRRETNQFPLSACVSLSPNLPCLPCQGAIR